MPALATITARAASPVALMIPVAWLLHVFVEDPVLRARPRLWWRAAETGYGIRGTSCISAPSRPGNTMTPGFSRLKVSGFRRLSDLNIKLRPLNVLIGANGVGKSSFLDVIDLLAASAGGNLQSTITNLGGMPSLLTADGKTNGLSFTLWMDQENASPLEYELRLVSETVGYLIAHEHLIQQQNLSLPGPLKYIDVNGPSVRYSRDGTLAAPNWEYKAQESALSQVPRTYPEAEGFRRLLADVSEVYHGLDVSVRSPVRTPQTLSPAKTPGIDGEELVSCLFTIRETARERFDAIEDALRAAFPAFERLDFPPVAAGRLTLTWREHGLASAFYASELSEGTLRFLWLATLLQSPGLPNVTLIDETEVSLHPEMLRLLADLMREASARTQLIVATHSDRLVRFLEPKELIICDRNENGGMTARWADDLDLGAWLEEYTLDQLWSNGVLGGRS
jgi:predicted ATPase